MNDTTPAPNPGTRLGRAIGYALVSLISGAVFYGVSVLVAAFWHAVGLPIDTFGAALLVAILLAVGYLRAGREETRNG